MSRKDQSCIGEIFNVEQRVSPRSHINWESSEKVRVCPVRDFNIQNEPVQLGFPHKKPSLFFTIR